MVFFLTDRTHFMSMHVTKWIYEWQHLSLTPHSPCSGSQLLPLAPKRTSSTEATRATNPCLQTAFPLEINSPERTLQAPSGWVLGAESGWCDTGTGVSLKLDIAAEHRREAQATRTKKSLSKWDARRAPFCYSRGPHGSHFHCWHFTGGSWRRIWKGWIHQLSRISSSVGSVIVLREEYQPLEM